MGKNQMRKKPLTKKLSLGLILILLLIIIFSTIIKKNQKILEGNAYYRRRTRMCKQSRPRCMY